MSGWYEVSKSSNGQFRFVLKAANAETILTSELYTTRVVAPRRAALRAVLERGVAEGQLDSDADLDVLLTCLSAPAILMGMHKARGQAPIATIPAVVDLVLAGVTTERCRTFKTPQVRARGAEL